jgi:D-3-phosphoglycerate dehydrogenase
MKILLTSSSFFDVPGRHIELLNRQGYDITAAGEVTDEACLLNIIDEYDALLSGDSKVTAAILQKGKAGRLKYISKYGIGVDNIDVAAAKQLGIPVTICLGVNQHAVADLAFGLLLSHARNIHLEYAITKAGGWKKLTGTELYDKTIGIIGFGAIGKEVAARAKSFGMKVVVATRHPDAADIEKRGCCLAANINELAVKSDIITLHVPLTPLTEGIISSELINTVLKRGAIIINTARGKLVDAGAIKKGLENGIIAAYLTDVLDIEPMPENYILHDAPNMLITPHIGSRTYESAERQGLRAVENLVNMLNGNVEAYKGYLV